MKKFNKDNYDTETNKNKYILGSECTFHVYSDATWGFFLRQKHLFNPSITSLSGKLVFSLDAKKFFLCLQTCNSSLCVHNFLRNLDDGVLYKFLLYKNTFYLCRLNVTITSVVSCHLFIKNF